MREIWTVGHWTCPEEVFTGLLSDQQITTLADVRAHPGSRSSPQFGQDTMRDWLEQADIAYVHLEQLGGRRRKQDVPVDINAGWANQSFKNYADYTLQPAYTEAILDLEKRAELQRVALMCAEPMPWRCHRLLISNTMAARGWTVRHIMAGGEPRTHVLGAWGADAQVDDCGRVVYPKAAAAPSD